MSKLRVFKAVLLIASLIFLSAQCFSQDSILSQEELDSVLPKKVMDEIGFDLEDEITLGISKANLASPHKALYSFLYFLQEETKNPTEAGKVLSEVDGMPYTQAELAVMLKHYFDGEGYFLDLHEIPRDPNYSDSTVGTNKFTPVKDIPKLYMYKRNNEWVFSKRSVLEIPSLYSKIYPFGKLDWIPDSKQPKYLGLFIWQWLGLLLFLISGILFIFILYWPGRLICSFVLQDKRPKVYKIILSLLIPISFLILVYLYETFIPVLEIPITANRYLMHFIRLMYPLFGTIFIYRLVDLVSNILEHFAEKTETKMDDQLIPLVKKGLKLFVFTSGLVIILQRSGVNVYTLMAGLSITGIALALAFQDTIQNLIGSFLIFLDRPFKIGDLIKVGDIFGFVEEVGIRTTRIRTFDHSVISIPNSRISGDSVDNLGVRSYWKFEAKIVLRYGTTPEKVEEFIEGIRTIIKEHPETKKDFFQVYLNEMNQFGLVIWMFLYLMIDDWPDELRCRHEILLSIIRLAQKLEVEFAIPSQQIFLENANNISQEFPKRP